MQDWLFRAQAQHIKFLALSPPPVTVGDHLYAAVAAGSDGKRLRRKRNPRARREFSRLTGMLR
jgi:hypothetical protein